MYSTVALKWNRKIQCGNSCRRISLPLCLVWERRSFVFGVGTAFPHLFFSNTFLPASNNFWTLSSAQHEIRCFLSTRFLAVFNDLFSTCCVVFPKLRYHDIVAFHTKIEWMRIWSLTHSKLHVSRCDVVKILSDHFQCPCDAINTVQGKVPA